jgi:shikimate kinase
MPLVAINGIPGAGKSSVYARLKALGLDAWDTDEDGLSEWRDRASKLPVPEPDDWHDEKATQGIEYRVRRDRVEDLRRRSTDHTVYLCGCAGGEEEFWDLLDRVICIAVDNDTLRHRLATRTTNDYGKAAHELERILAENVTWAEQYRGFGAVIVDGKQPIDDVVADIIKAAEA